MRRSAGGACWLICAPCYDALRDVLRQKQGREASPRVCDLVASGYGASIGYAPGAAGGCVTIRVKIGRCPRC
jgi:hypothetical protein